MVLRYGYWDLCLNNGIYHANYMLILLHYMLQNENNIVFSIGKMALSCTVSPVERNTYYLRNNFKIRFIYALSQCVNRVY